MERLKSLWKLNMRYNLTDGLDVKNLYNYELSFNTQIFLGKKLESKEVLVTRYL